MRAELTDPYGPIDFALFGCPHITIEQISVIAHMVRGRQLAVPMFCMTSALTRADAEKMGYLDDIERAGGYIVADTCMDQPCWKFLYGKHGVTDSPKCAYYTKRRDMTFVITELERAVDAALVGRIDEPQGPRAPFPGVEVAKGTTGVSHSFAPVRLSSSTGFRTVKANKSAKTAMSGQER